MYCSDIIGEPVGLKLVRLQSSLAINVVGTFMVVSSLNGQLIQALESRLDNDASVRICSFVSDKIQCNSSTFQSSVQYNDHVYPDQLLFLYHTWEEVYYR